MAPDSCGDEFDGGEEIGGVFVVAGGDATELFDSVEEALDRVALAVNPARKGKALLAVRLRRNVRPGFPLRRLGTDGIAVVALVGEQDVALAEGVGQSLRLLAVGNLPGSQPQSDWAAFRIDEGVDLAGEPAAGTSHAAIVCAPLFPVAACWWTRTQVESIMTMSPS